MQITPSEQQGESSDRGASYADLRKKNRVEPEPMPSLQQNTYSEQSARDSKPKPRTNKYGDIIEE